jgi:hypothetical protein
MCVEFAVIKGLLISISGHYGDEFGSKQVLRLIQAVAKATEHTTGIQEALNWQGLADANSIAALLKN